MYRLKRFPEVVPELIELAEWRRLLHPQPSGAARFTVLFVGRLYRRKRVDLLLRAAAALRERIRGLEVRIVGNGPCGAALGRQARDLKLSGTVTWLGDFFRCRN